MLRFHVVRSTFLLVWILLPVASTGAEFTTILNIPPDAGVNTVGSDTQVRAIAP